MNWRINQSSVLFNRLYFGKIVFSYSLLNLTCKLCLIGDIHCVKSVQRRSYFWSVFSCIRTEYRKIRTRNNSVFGHFSRSDVFPFFRYKIWKVRLFLRFWSHRTTIHLTETLVFDTGEKKISLIPKKLITGSGQLPVTLSSFQPSLLIFPEADLGLLQHLRWSALWW